MSILKFVIRFIILFFAFPIFWFLYGLYAYLRVLFTYDTLNIYFDKHIKTFDFPMFKDK